MKSSPALISSVLVAATLVAFWGVWSFDFTNYDDPAYVAENVHVASLTAANVGWAFSSFYESTWIPITWVSFMVDSEIWGRGPSGYHLTNLLLHMASTLLLFRLFSTMTGCRGRSAFIAALFALHPLHVESVAWVTERKDVLSALLGVLSLTAFAAWTRAGRAWRYAAALGCLALGLMAKPVLVTWPFVLLLLDVWPLRRLREISDLPRLVIEKLPFLALSAASSTLTYLAHRSTLVPLESLGIASRLANGALSYGRYLLLTFWPVDLAVMYPHRTLSGLSVLAATLAAVLLTVASVLAALQWKRRPWLPVGWFWFLGVLVPVSGLVQFGDQALADRFMYLPMIGLGVVLAWGGHELLEAIGVRRRLVVTLAVVTLGCLGAATWVQARYWRNSEALFRRALLVTDGASASAHYNLATDLSTRGELEASVAHYEAAIRLDPARQTAYGNLALVASRLGNPDRARALYATALELAPEALQIRVNLGVLQAQEGDLTAAEATFRHALGIDATDIDARYNLALVLARNGDLANARVELGVLLQQHPGNPSALALLAELPAIESAAPESRGSDRH